MKPVICGEVDSHMRLNIFDKVSGATVDSAITCTGTTPCPRSVNLWNGPL